MSDPIADLVAEVVNRQTLCAPERIRMIREGAGISQRRLGEALGVNHATVNRWEAGDRRPSDRQYEPLIRLLSALQRVTPGEAGGDLATLPLPSSTDVSVAFDETNVRVANALKRSHIRTLNDLTQVCEFDLRKIRNFGEKSVQRVKEVLARYGLELPAATTLPAWEEPELTWWELQQQQRRGAAS